MTGAKLFGATDRGRPRQRERTDACFQKALTRFIPGGGIEGARVKSDD